MLLLLLVSGAVLLLCVLLDLAAVKSARALQSEYCVRMKGVRGLA